MKDIQTKITGATVFRDGARIVRTGKTELAKGEHIIRVGGITEYAHQDSFRVKGRGNAVLRGIDVKQTSKTYEPEGNVKEILNQLRSLEKERNNVQDQKDLQLSRIANQTAIMTQYSAEFGKWFSVGETGMDNLTKMDKANRNMMKDAKKKIRDLSRQLEKIDTEIASIRENIHRIQGERRTETLTEVYVTLDAKASTPLELEITYQISLASWHPTYDVDIGEGTTSLKRIAMIQNNSMENWEDVNLAVSTASARPVEAVKPKPFYVDTYSASIGGYGMGGGIEGMSMAKMDEMQESASIDVDAFAEEEPMPEMIEQYATSSESLGGITVYEVPGEVTITANDGPHPVTLTFDEFESKRLHFWNASAMPEVVAQDEITNGDSVLLPGSVKVYAAGDFVGETSLGNIAPREKFRLGIRAAYDVKAEKKLLEKDTEKAGFSRGKQKRQYKYALELKNFSKHDIEIRVVDRIPYSNSEKIVVEIAEPSMAFKSMELGIITWETKMISSQELSIEYGFEVEWEKDLIVRPPLP